MLLGSIQYLKMLAVCCKSLRNLTPSPKVHHELKDTWNLKEASQEQLLNIKFIRLPTRDDGVQGLFLCCGKCTLCFADRIKKKCLPWGSCRLLTKSFQCCTFCASPEEQRSVNIREEEKIYKLCLQKRSRTGVDIVNAGNTSCSRLVKETEHRGKK